MYSLPVGDDDDEDGGDAAEDDDGQGEERALRVAHRLHRLLHVGHQVRRADLQDASAAAQIRLELLVDVQQLPVQEPYGTCTTGTRDSCLVSEQVLEPAIELSGDKQLPSHL